MSTRQEKWGREEGCGRMGEVLAQVDILTEVLVTKVHAL